MRRNSGQVETFAVALLGASLLVACDDDDRNELQGELGNGTFTYQCKLASDAQCDEDQLTSDLALVNIVRDGRFGIDYSEDIGALRASSPDRLADEGAGLWWAKEAGWVAIIAVDDDEGEDFAHLQIVEPVGLRISRRDAAGSFIGSVTTTAVSVTIGDTVVLRVAPMDGQNEVLAGGLECVWSSSDTTVAEIVGDETDNVIEVRGNQIGTASLQVNLAGLTDWVTIEVGG